MSKDSSADGSKALGQDRLNVDTDGRRNILGPGDEIRNTGQDTDVALSLDGREGLDESDQPPAGDDLSAGHQGTITTVQRAHVARDVRVADDGETEGHLSLIRLNCDYGICSLCLILDCYLLA